MSLSSWPGWRGIAKPVIGMVHLPPLPGAPRYAGDLRALRRFVRRDAEALAAGGVHALLLENFGDVPFAPVRAPAETVACLTALACEVARRVGLPLGINVLRNDGLSALAVAHASGASFIRVNVLIGARLTDQGLLSGIAHALLRARRTLGARVKILADVDVKHSAPLADYALEDEVKDTIERGLADAVVVSGSGTGRPVAQDRLERVRAAAGGTPVFVGSGVTPETLAELWSAADGFIVGTALKRDGHVRQPVDPRRVAAFMQAWAAAASG